MKDPLIHIGYHKTGTTWLQLELFMSDNKTFEPLSRRAMGQSSLARLFFKDNFNLLSSFESNEVEIRKEIEHLLTVRPALKSKYPVLSSERLSGFPHGGGFDSSLIANRLKNVFPNSKILIVIREQKSAILSNYLQYLYNGGVHDIDHYLRLNYGGRHPFFSPAHFDYLPLIEKYRELFGESKVLVLPYELFKSAPDNFFAALENFLDVKVYWNSDRVKVIRNRQQKHFVRYYFRFLNLFAIKSSLNDYSILSTGYLSRIAKLLIRFISFCVPESLNNQTKRKLKVVVDNWAGDRYKESNKRLSDLIQHNLAEFGYH